MLAQVVKDLIKKQLIAYAANPVHARLGLDKTGWIFVLDLKKKKLTAFGRQAWKIKCARFLFSVWKFPLQDTSTVVPRGHVRSSLLSVSDLLPIEAFGVINLFACLGQVLPIEAFRAISFETKATMLGIFLQKEQPCNFQRKSLAAVFKVPYLRP